MATILVGEDDEFLLQLIRVALSMDGFQVEVARDGKSALALAARRPDAALLDVGLPGATGTEVLRALRQKQETRHLPVALMSGVNPAHSDLADAQAFVRKPFTMAAVSATMRGLVHGATR